MIVKIDRYLPTYCLIKKPIINNDFIKFEFHMNPENKHNNLYSIHNIQTLEVYLVNKKCIYIYIIYLEEYEQ